MYALINQDGTLRSANKQHEGFTPLSDFERSEVEASDFNQKGQTGFWYAEFYQITPNADGIYEKDDGKIAEKQGIELNLHIETLIQDHLDTNAKKWGYDSIHTAVGYIGDPDTTFHNEGVMFRNWRSAVWLYVNVERVKFEQGTRIIPTDEALIAELPKIETYQ